MYGVLLGMVRKEEEESDLNKLLEDPKRQESHQQAIERIADQIDRLSDKLAKTTNPDDIKKLHAAIASVIAN